MSIGGCGVSWQNRRNLGSKKVGADFLGRQCTVRQSGDDRGFDSSWVRVKTGKAVS